MDMNEPPQQSNPEHGYGLDFGLDTRQVTHQFCGNPEIAGADCPNCQQPLMRLLSLSAADPLVNFDSSKTPAVHLLYCWRCSIPFGQFSYKVKHDGSVEVLQLPEREPSMEFGPSGPYDGFTGEFQLRDISLKLLYDGTDEPRHQVGGEPFISNPQDVICPSCATPSPFLATICNDATGNDPWNDVESCTFTGNGGVQMVFHYCRNCSVVSAYHSCD